MSDNGAQMIQDYTDEILYYHEELDVYLWGVTHCGTSWDYVLMDIPCNCGYDEEINDWRGHHEKAILYHSWPFWECV